MNLREAIEAYANAMISYYSNLGHGKQEAESIARLVRCSKSLDVVLAVAESAMAYMEHQAARVYDPDECDLAYAQQRGKLWDAFIEARKKAANQS